MNFFTVIFFVTLALVNGDDEKYTTKYDNVDLDEILKNDRLLTGYTNCLLGKGACTADGKELKKALPDALQNDCSKCSEKQKSGSRKVLEYLIVNKEDVYNELSALYDPNGDYKKRYCKVAKDEGIDTKDKC